MRRRSHAEAQSEPFSAAEFPDHPLIPAGEPELIDGDEQLGLLLAHAQNIGRFCYDTEFIGESYYHPHLCLIQIATPERVAVIDALAGVDPTPIWELVADPRVVTIVHAGQQDLEPVVRHLGRPPANVFDTQIVGGFVALPYPLSLSRLTLELLGIRLGKRLTFTSWDQRPLSHAHIHYAADDVRFGLALCEELNKRLEANGNGDRARRHCQRLCDPRLYQTNLAENAAKMRGNKSLKRPQAAALYELVVLRDELAKIHDLPPRSTIRDDILIDLARRRPRSVEELDGVRGLPRPIKADHGHRLIDAVQRGIERRKPPWSVDRQHEESPGEQFRIDAMWAFAQAHCRSMQVDPALLGNRADFAGFFRRASSDRLAKPDDGGDWRQQFLYERIAPLLRGEQCVAFDWDVDRKMLRECSDGSGQIGPDRR